MLVELRDIDTIKPYANNPRRNDRAVAAVAASIEAFGFRQPLVIDEDGVIIVGSTRYKAALLLGLKQVPVHVAVGLTPAQARAYRLADNKTAELAEWDDSLLVQEIAALQEIDFDLDLTGFTADEIRELVSAEMAPGLIDPDAVPAPPDAAVTQPGDLWHLGKHRLLCGDSSKAEDVDCLLEGADIHLVNTDPPYNVKVEPRSNNAIAAGLSSFTYGNSDPGRDVVRCPEKSQPTHKKLRAKDRPLANDFVSAEEFDRLLRAWFGNLARARWWRPGRSVNLIANAISLFEPARGAWDWSRGVCYPLDGFSQKEGGLCLGMRVGEVEGGKTAHLKGPPKRSIPTATSPIPCMTIPTTNTASMRVGTSIPGCRPGRPRWSATICRGVIPKLSLCRRRRT
jgi:hypothetical protein